MGLADSLRGAAGALRRRLGGHYRTQMRRELERYRTVERIHNLPAIFHYWSNKYIRPRFEALGFAHARDCYGRYLERICRAHDDATCRFLSIGSGNGDLEVELARRLVDAGFTRFHLAGLDVNPAMLERGRAAAEAKGVADRVAFVQADINRWEPDGAYHAIIVNQALHHFTGLERLFDRIAKALRPDGFFLTDEMVGRNGHRRWPEALAVVEDLWSDLPERLKFNHSNGRVDRAYDDRDWSDAGFEGVRAQDILPLLMARFHFELFVGFANVIDPFVERAYGPNFNAEDPGDRALIDRIHARDDALLDAGTIKPTHMLAALCVRPPPALRCYRHWTPEFCVRRP